MTNIPKLSIKDQNISVTLTLTLKLFGRSNVVVFYFNLKGCVVVSIKTKYKYNISQNSLDKKNFKHEKIKTNLVQISCFCDLDLDL